jgi:hypothetical protein
VNASFDKLKNSKGDSQGYVPLKYDAEKIKEFYDRYPLKQAARLAEVVLSSVQYLAILLGDKILNRDFTTIERERSI